MEDPFPSLTSDPFPAPVPAAQTTRAPKKVETQPDVSSEDAFPSLNTLSTGSSSKQAGSAWVSSVPVIQRVTHQATVALNLGEEQLARLGQGLQRVQQKHRSVKVEASSTRKTGNTTFIIKGPTDQVVQQVKRELTALFARKVSISVLVPASLRAYVIGAGGKNVKSITEETGVKINIPPRSNQEATVSSEGPLLDEQVEVTIEGDQVNALQAQRMIEAIVAERTSKVTQRLADIDHMYYPFIAGTRNANLDLLVAGPGRGEVVVNIPPRGALLARNNPDDPEPSRQRDPAIVISGDREAVADVVGAIQAHVVDMKNKFRTLMINIPKRQHQFLTGDNAADILATSQCFVELPPIADPSDSVTIRGPQQQLPNALTAVIEKANSVHVQVVDLPALHAAGDAHARQLAQWLQPRISRDPNVQVYFPRAGAPPVVEIVGKDAGAVQQMRASVEDMARSVDPSCMRVVDIDPLAHGFIIGKKGQGLKAFESRGVDILVPPENSGRSDILLVLGRPAALPSDAAAKAAAATKLFDEAEQELKQSLATAADMRTMQIEVPAKYHRAIVGHDGTVLNAIIGEDRLMIVMGTSRDVRNKQYTAKPLTEDAILVRGSSEAVERAVDKIRAIAKDAEQDSIAHGHVEELLVPSSHVPHLIGRGGAGLIKLREELGVKIDVADQDEKTRRAPIPITITGRKECVLEAKNRLAEQSQRLADEVSVALQVPYALYGALIGQRGKYVTRLQDKYEVRINFGDVPLDAQAQDQPGEVTIRGAKKGVAEAKAELLELLDYEKNHNNGAQLSVPSKAFARVLGRGGATINQIRTDTGAQVDLERRGNADGLVRIRGTSDAVERAKSAIEEIIARVESEATHVLAIPARFHGALIGSGGQNLRELLVRAGGPTDAKSQSQCVRFPRSGQPSDEVSVCAHKELAARIALELEAECKRLEDRVMLGAIVPPNMHRQMIMRGGTRQSEWQTKHNVAVVVPNWREYADLGVPANLADLGEAEAATIVKVHGPCDAAKSIVEEINAAVHADAARKKTRAPRIDS
ncbi:hypothetical protein MVES1_002598 [Malassezia vespertilionis]|nr:uncharacterized protein MVES1_002598 [Malassezia vespertilionis]WFD07238.1 hypothetical protein MVES1_002598 [Malassezia vespertilionis]